MNNPNSTNVWESPVSGLFEKINRELEVCRSCSKHFLCTTPDRMDKSICQLLRERMQGK